MGIDEALVDDAAGGWVRWLAVLVLHKEALRDPLVHDDYGDFWFLVLVAVNLLDRALKLGNLARQNLASLSIGHTIPVDDEVSWELAIIPIGKSQDSLLEGVPHAVLDNLLTLLLDQVLRVVLGHLLVDARREANNRLWPRMTHINANQHGTLALEGLRELQVIQVTTSFAVDLTQDVRSF